MLWGHGLSLALEDLSIMLPQQSNNLLSICFVTGFNFSVIGRVPHTQTTRGTGDKDIGR